MNDNNNKYAYMRALAHLTQFGLSMVSPVLLCTLLSLWLKDTFNTGNWVVIVAIILGVCASGLNMMKFIKVVKNEMRGKEHDEERKD